MPNEIINTLLRGLGERFSLRPLDASPYQKTGGGLLSPVTVLLEAREGDGFTVSLLEIRAMMGAVRAELLVCTPVLRDAPLALCGMIHAPGRDSLHLEALDTLVAPCELSGLAAAVAAHPESADHPSSLGWYENRKLPVCCCRELGENDPRALSLTRDWIRAYTECLAAAAPCGAEEKKRGTEALMAAFLDGGSALKTVYALLGEEKAKALLRKAMMP